VDSYDQLQTDVYYLAGRKRDYTAARDRIEIFAAKAQGTDSGRVTWLRGSVLREEGHLREAMVNFHVAADQLDGDPFLLAACLLDCGALANQTGDLSQAEATATRFFELVATHPEARQLEEVMYGIRGDTCYLRGDTLGAIDWYKQALRKLEDPSVASLPKEQLLCMVGLHWHSLARCYLSLGDLVRARFAIEGVRHCRHPDLLGLAACDECQVCLHIGALVQAEDWLDQAEQNIRNPQNRQYVLLGRIQLAQARGDMAAVGAYRQRLESEHDVILHEIQLQLEELPMKEGVQS